MPRARNPAPAPLRGVSFVGWLAIVAFVAGSVAHQLGALPRSSTLVVLAAALVAYAALVALLALLGRTP